MGHSERGETQVDRHGLRYSPDLYNEDLAPTDAAHRTWGIYHIASLWVGMAVCIPSYMLAAQMISNGMTWVEAMVLVALGNAIVLVPMILNAHAGTQYGIPFPVLARAAFGIRGAHIPSIIRAIVACGWFGIQCWIGGAALDTLLGVLVPAWHGSTLSSLLPILGISIHAFVAWIAFWLMNMYFVWKGTESIKMLEAYAAPVLILIGLALLGWGTTNGGGLANVLAKSHELGKKTVKVFAVTEKGFELGFDVLKGRDGQPKARWIQIGDVLDDAGLEIQIKGEGIAPWIAYAASVPLEPKLSSSGMVYVRFDDDQEDAKGRMSSILTVPLVPTQSAGEEPSRILKYLLFLTAMAGFWATLALNIPDITRYAKGQREQMIGQAIGLPGTMVLYAFIGVAVTCSTVIIFDDIVIPEDALWDPVALLARFDSPALVLLSMFALSIATLTTNLAANIVSPANSFSNAFPRQISFMTGGLIAGLLGLFMMPWKLLGEYISWLVTYSAFLGPVLGVLLADYYMVRKGKIDVEHLYQWDGPYKYKGGFNPAAMAAMAAGIAVVGVGKLVPALGFLYDGAWFTGLGVAMVVYTLSMKFIPASNLGTKPLD